MTCKGAGKKGMACAQMGKGRSLSLPFLSMVPSIMAAQVQIYMAHPISEEEEGDVVVTVHPRGTTSLDVIRARLDSTPSQEDPFLCC